MDELESEQLLSSFQNINMLQCINFDELTADVIENNKIEINQEIEAIESIFMQDVKVQHYKNAFVSISQECKTFSLQIAAELQFRIYPENKFPAQLTKVMSSSSADGIYDKFEEIKNQNDVRIRVYDFEYLPCFELTILIPVSYPSTSPPLFRISKQDFYSECDALIQTRFTELFAAGFTCIFEWHSYLQDEFVCDFTTQNNIDCLRYSAEKREEYDDIQRRSKETFCFRFSNKETYCPICYEELFGYEFNIVDGCYHYFCKTCMKDYLTNLISDGKTKDIKCPQSKCNKTMTDNNIREFSGKEMFEKLEKFRLQHKIDFSEDHTWCPIPECSAIAVIKGKGMFGECTECWFRFCLICNNYYHTGKRCPKIGVGKTVFEKLSKSEQEEFIQDQLNDFYISKYSKNCPKCNVTITKMTGCNKMICQQCGVYFCWKCMEIIQGYQHFELNPGCWDTTGQRDNKALNDKDIESVKEGFFGTNFSIANSVSCPECKKSQIITALRKTTEVNLLSCNKCGSNVCYYCGKLAEPDHYLTSSCCKTSK